MRIFGIKEVLEKATFEGGVLEVSGRLFNSGTPKKGTPSIHHFENEEEDDGR